MSGTAICVIMEQLKRPSVTNFLMAVAASGRVVSCSDVRSQEEVIKAVKMAIPNDPETLQRYLDMVEILFSEVKTIVRE